MADRHFHAAGSTASSGIAGAEQSADAHIPGGTSMAAHDALRTILPVAGLPEERARTVEITGGSDPVLPTPFRIGETSAACLGAIGLAVSDLWELRTGRKQEAAVGVPRATAPPRSRHYPKMEKGQTPHERHPATGLY